MVTNGSKPLYQIKTEINIKQIRPLQGYNGFAFAYQKYSDAYIKDEEFAKMKKLGLWNMIFEYPWIYRKNN